MMCNMKRLILSLAAAFLLIGSLAGQDVREQSLYRDRAGWNTQVFRGKAADKISTERQCRRGG